MSACLLHPQLRTYRCDAAKGAIGTGGGAPVYLIATRFCINGVRINDPLHSDRAGVRVVRVVSQQHRKFEFKLNCCLLSHSPAPIACAASSEVVWSLLFDPGVCLPKPAPVPPIREIPLKYVAQF